MVVLLKRIKVLYDTVVIQTLTMGLTWVMEGHEEKGASLPRAVGPALNDGVGPEASGSDLLEHAARGVHDKDQGGDLLHAEEPVKGGLARQKAEICNIIYILGSTWAHNWNWK